MFLWFFSFKLRLEVWSSTLRVRRCSASNVWGCLGDLQLWSGKLLHPIGHRLEDSMHHPTTLMFLLKAYLKAHLCSVSNIFLQGWIGHRLKWPRHWICPRAAELQSMWQNMIKPANGERVFGISEFQDPHWLQNFFSACCASHLNRDPDPATRQARSRCRTNAWVVPTVVRPNCEKRTHQRCTNGNEINDVERVPLVHDITYITDDRHMTQRSQVAAPGHALCTRMRCLWGRGAEEQPPSSAADGQAQSLKHLKRRKHTVKHV